MELYGFAPLRTSGSTTVRGITADLDLDQVLRPLTSAAFIRGSIEHGRFGFLTDLSDLSLKGAEGRTLPSRELERTFAGRNFSRSFGPRDRGEASVGIGESSITASRGQSSVRSSIDNIQGIYDFALRYRFGDRVQGPSLDASVQGARRGGSASRPGNLATLVTPSRTIVRTGEFGGTVVQPLVGTQAMVFVSPRLRLFPRADIGRLGLNNSDDYSWNAQAGLGYAIGNSTQLNLSWRYLHLSGSNDTVPANADSINENGGEIGLKFLF